MAVQDVDALDLVEQVLLAVGAVDVGHAGIEAAAQRGHVAGLGEALLERPLFLVLELGLVRMLVVGGIQVGHAGTQAGFHDGQVLIGQGHMDQHVGLERFDQRNQRLDVIGVDLGGLDGAVQLVRDRLALRFVATRQTDFVEHLGVLCALVRDHTPDAAGANNQGFTHAFASRSEIQQWSNRGAMPPAASRCHSRPATWQEGADNRPDGGGAQVFFTKNGEIRTMRGAFNPIMPGAGS